MSLGNMNENRDAPPHSVADGFLFGGACVRREPNRDPAARQKALVALGRRAIAPPTLDALIADAVALLAEMLKADMVLLAELAPDGQTMGCRITRPGAEEDNARSWTGTTSIAGNRSLPGFVLQCMRPIVVVDLSREDRFIDVGLRQHGALSAVAAPLSIGETIYGMLAACSELPAKFDDEDMLFIESVAQLIAASIARAQAERRLAEEQRLSQDLLNKVESIVLILDFSGRILRINPACERITGFTQEEISKRHFGDAFAIPKEASLIAAAIKRCAAGQTVELETCLLTRQGHPRTVAWKFSPAGEQNTSAIMASGIDVTRKRELENQVQAQRGVEAEAAAKLAEASAFPMDRRRRPRRAYPYRQSIGYIFDEELPDKSQFIEVMCHDIGPGGFSFLSPTPPPSQSLVVALGTAPNVTCMTARIVHCRQTQYHGRAMYFIGCSYLGRAVFN